MHPPSSLSAKIKVDGTTYNVMKGDKVPGGSAAEFTVSGVTSGDVSFSVIDGKLESGDKSFTVNLGEAVRVTLDSGVSYNISVIAIGQGGGGGRQRGGGTTAHSISVLSVTSQNGTALVTVKVDGKTYSDLEAGRRDRHLAGVRSRCVAISVDGQTVTIMHGDQTFTLHAGQVVVK